MDKQLEHTAWTSNLDKYAARKCNTWPYMHHMPLNRNMFSIHLDTTQMAIDNSLPGEKYAGSAEFIFIHCIYRVGR
jgi:hypothetical protein